MTSGHPSRYKVLRAIENCVKRGFSPKLQDLCLLTGIQSRSTILYHVDDLEREGLIRRDDKRNIEVAGMARAPRLRRPDYKGESEPKPDRKWRAAVARMPKGKALQARIEMVVRMAMLRQAQQPSEAIKNRVDILHSDHRRMSFRAKAHKVG